MSRSGRTGASAGGQKGAFGGSAAQACPFFPWPRNFTVAVRKGLKDTTSTHRTSGSIFPRPPRALFQPCSRGLGRAQRGGMPAPSRAHKARGRLAFSTGPDADTSGRARALGPWCPLPLACSHLQRHQPPALPTRFQIFDFDSLRGSINGSHPLTHSLIYTISSIFN